MNIAESVRVGVRGLTANKMRTALTALGVIIGVGAVIAMISIGEGAKAQVSEGIRAMGSNLLTVRPGAERRGMVRGGIGSAQTLTYEDAQAIERECSLVRNVAPELSRPAQVKYQNKNINTSIVGTTPSYEEVRKFRVASGSFITERDVKVRRKVAVLGQTVVDNLFDEINLNPIGQFIKINNINFRVIGVMETKGQMTWFDQDDQIFIPLTTAQKRLFGIDHLRNINVQAASEDVMEEATEKITEVMKRQHRIGPYSEPDFHVRSQAEILSMMQETSRTFTYLLAGIASVSLIVGGIGIMNIMLVSVTERTREIGIRMAVGARSRDILGQFLIESMVLSIIGGMIGIVLGVAGSKAISLLAQWNTVISPGSILLAFSFAAAVGIFFGIYPARKAANLDPIESLRYE